MCINVVCRVLYKNKAYELSSLTFCEFRQWH